jgi:hypothetical protein
MKITILFYCAYLKFYSIFINLQMRGGGGGEKEYDIQ